MPLPYGWASESTVIQSPASRAARRRSCQVRSVSAASVRSSSPNANQRASSSGSRKSRSATNRSAVGRSSPGRVPEAARDGGQERPADAVDEPDARARRAAGRRGTPGRRAFVRPAVSAVAKPSGSLVNSARAAPSASAGSRWAATKATARAVTSLAGRRASIIASASGVGRAVGVALAQVALAVRARRRRTTPVAVASSAPVVASTMCPAVSTIRRRERVIHPSARIGCRPSTGRRKSTAIRAVTPQLSSPTRAQAITSSRIVHRIPPWVTPSQPSNRRSSVAARPTTARLDVEDEPEAARVERPAGEAVVRRELEPTGRRLDRRAGGGGCRGVGGLRRQGSAPCVPRS